MSDLLNDLDKRLSILEMEFKNMQDAIEKIYSASEANKANTAEIRSRLDSWNGSIPHIYTAVKDIQNNQKHLNEALTNNKVNDATNETKIKILWSVIGALGVALLGSLVKTLFTQG